MLCNRTDLWGFRGIPCGRALITFGELAGKSAIKCTSYNVIVVKHNYY